MIYVHTVVGGISVALLVWIGMQGLRSRHPRPYAEASRARHERWAKWIYGAILLSMVTGMLSTVLLRADLDFADSRHFWLGGATVIILGLNGGVWHMMDTERAAPLHRWIGLMALGLAGVQAALGLSLLP